MIKVLFVFGVNSEPPAPWEMDATLPALPRVGEFIRLETEEDGPPEGRTFRVHDVTYYLEPGKPVVVACDEVPETEWGA